MKTLTLKNAIRRLRSIREDFRRLIENGYETNAKECETCEAQGSCCTDGHFVNVRVTRLEAAAIEEALTELPRATAVKVIGKARKIPSRISERQAERQDAYFYSCPLFEPGIGCLVHKTSKPLPCINHACYEKKEDLPPSALLEDAEAKVSLLNQRVYRNSWSVLPIPSWISRSDESRL